MFIVDQKPNSKFWVSFFPKVDTLNEYIYIFFLEKSSFFAVPGCSSSKKVELKCSHNVGNRFTKDPILIRNLNQAFFYIKHPCYLF